MVLRSQRGPCLAPLPPFFFGGEGAALFVFCMAKEEGKGAACGTTAEPPRPQGLPLPTTQAMRFFFAAPAPKKGTLYHGGEAARPPCARWAGMGG